MTLAAAYFLLAVLLIVTRRWLRYPLFTALMLAYVPILATWDPGPGTIQPLAVLKLGAVIEALRRATEESQDPLQLIFGAAMGGAVALGVARYYSSPYITEAQAFHDLSHWFLAGFAVSGVAVVWRFVPHFERRDAVHGLLLTAFLLNHVAWGVRYLQVLVTGLASRADWLSVREAYQGGCLLLVGCWCAWGIRYARLR